MRGQLSRPPRRRSRPSSATPGRHRTPAPTFVRATSFTTGTGTYTVSSVGIYLANVPGGGITPVVQVYGDTSGNPGTLVATMTNPGTFDDDAVNTFTAPANTMLSASTTYWLVTTNSAATTGVGFQVRTIANTNLDSGTAAGWSIGNARFKSDIANTSWSTSSSRHRFAIRGTAGTTTNNPPTVANTIPDQSATAGTAFTYAFPDTTFSDEDSDMLTYMATKSDGTALPTWLSFTASTRTFSGTPQAADVGPVSVKVTASDGNGGSVSDEFDITVSAASNTLATGAPTITGTPQVGQTLTAVTTAIMDANGLTTVSYTYQWIRVDGGTETNISLATASTYTLVPADQGKTIKVKVSFTDDANNPETLTSAATATVTAAGTAAPGQVMGVGVAPGNAHLVVVRPLDDHDLDRGGGVRTAGLSVNRVDRLT